ncbi:MAG: S8 family serine peptidase [Acidobacteriota bacterium]|nr:S8 family serine peptidase [Acidobacteriota bacterium]
MNFFQWIALPLAVLTAAIPAFGDRNDEPAKYRDGVVLVRFRGDILQDRKNSVFSTVLANEIKRIGVGVHVLHVGRGREFAVIQALKALGDILYAEPDYVHTLDGGPLPNDPSLGSQWAVQNTGQSVNGTSGTTGADERLPAAWGVTTGTNSVVVAVLDSGVQYSHPDLLTNIWNNPGGIGGCAAGTHGYNVLSASCDPMDDEISYGGHGSHVAGIAGAVGNNAAGVSGVNWTTSLMPVKWFPASGSGATSDLISAMDWVVKAKQSGVNVRVVNDSATWPGTGFSQALSDEIDLLGANDILFVAAAGNTAQNDDTIPRYPCSYDRPNMICVGASDQNDRLWSSSNFGMTTVKLAAPGVNIYSTKRLSDYGLISGCSMAAPQVSGTAALILSLGYQSVSQLRSTILNSVDVLPSLTGLVSTGGRLNVCKAVPGCTSSAMTTPSILSNPVITGIPQYGLTLGASAGTWSGNPTTYTYQWSRCVNNGVNCSAIPGATSQSYAILASIDSGATLAVTVTASNASGAASAQSSASAVVGAAASLFAVNSSIHDGQVIGGSVQWLATPAQPVNFVQFYIDGVLSQTVSFSPYVYNQTTTSLLDTTTMASGTHILGVRALAADNRTYVFYGATVTVSNPPANTSPPVISGSPVPGQTLSTSNGAWTNNPTGYGYQWNRCASNGSNCVAVPGANGNAYLVANADSGSSIRSAVTATNSSGSNTVLSAPTAIGATGGTGVALVQSNAAQGSGVVSFSTSFLSGNTAGNLIVAALRMSSSSQTVQVTDSNGNVYLDAVSQVQTADGHQVHIFYARNILGGANTVTATFSAANNHPWLAIYEYSGLSAASPLDQTTHSQGNGSATSSGATGVTANPNELLFVITGLPYSYGGTVSPGGGYTLQQQNTGTSRGANEAAVVAATGSYTGTFSLSSSANWSSAMATFVASGAVAPPPGAPSIATSALPNGIQNTAYNARVSATGGKTPYTWSIVLGALPTGLSLAASTGAISGVPTGTGASSFTLQVTDANAQSAAKGFSITISPAAATGISLIQSNAAQGSGVTSLSTAFLSGNTAGNLVIAFVRMSSASQTVQIADSAGNVYTDAVSQAQTTDGHQVHIFYAKNVSGGANTVTASFSATNNHPWIAIYEYSGLSATNPLDQTAHAQGSGASPSTGPAGATTSANELVFTGAGFPYSYGGTAASGSGFAMQQQNTATSRGASETALVNAAGSYAGTFSLSSSANWSAVLATFKP